MQKIPRNNLNAAARKVAAASGHEILYRETYSAESGQIQIIWQCKDVGKEPGPTIELVCRPNLLSGAGWVGGFVVLSAARECLRSVLLVPDSLRLGGKRAGKLARERFCETAELLSKDPNKGLVRGRTPPSSSAPQHTRGSGNAAKETLERNFL